jgi:DNA polymerase III gamma/tau subunit
MRDLMVLRIDAGRASDPDIASETERDRLLALAQLYSREDLLRSFDLLATAERDLRSSSQPRHTFEMAMLKWIHLRKLTPIEELLAGGSTPAPPHRSTPAPQHRSTAAPPPRSTAAPASAKAPAGKPQHPTPAPQHPSTSAPLKQTLLAAIRDANKVFYGMVIAQVQAVEVEGDRIVFTFAPAHKNLKSQLETKRGWIEQLAQHQTGRKMTVEVKEGVAAPAAEARGSEPGAAARPSADKRQELREKAKDEPAVQTILDVLGGEIEDVEEIT